MGNTSPRWIAPTCGASRRSLGRSMPNATPATPTERAVPSIKPSLARQTRCRMAADPRCGGAPGPRLISDLARGRAPIRTAGVPSLMEVLTPLGPIDRRIQRREASRLRESTHHHRIPPRRAHSMRRALRVPTTNASRLASRWVCVQWHELRAGSSGTSLSPWRGRSVGLACRLGKAQRAGSRSAFWRLSLRHRPVLPRAAGQIVSGAGPTP